MPVAGVTWIDGCGNGAVGVELHRRACDQRRRFAVGRRSPPRCAAAGDGRAVDPPVAERERAAHRCTETEKAPPAGGPMDSGRVQVAVGRRRSRREALDEDVRRRPGTPVPPTVTVWPGTRPVDGVTVRPGAAAASDRSGDGAGSPAGGRGRRERQRTEGQHHDRRANRRRMSPSSPADAPPGDAIGRIVRTPGCRQWSAASRTASSPAGMRRASRTRPGWWCSADHSATGSGLPTARSSSAPISPWRS